MRRLTPEQWDAFCTSLRGTTAMQDGGPEVMAWGDARIAESQRKAAGGRMTAQKREEEVRDRLIAAAGAMGLIVTLRGWSATLERRIRAATPQKYGLSSVPDRRTIYKARDHLLANGTTLASCTPPHPVRFNTTSPTT